MSTDSWTDQLSFYCLDELKRMSDGDNEFVAEILETITENCPAVASSLESHFQSGDMKSLAFVLHKFKSTVHILGNQSLNTLIADLETMAKSLAPKESFQDEIKKLVTVIRILAEKLSKEASVAR